MRTSNGIFALIAAAAFAVACSDSDDEGGPGPGTDVQVTADVTASATWTADKVYVLTKHIAVTNGATLTIEPGTEIRGAQGSSLIVRTDGRIVADGTAAAPIVFTSNNAANAKAAGDWGGIVLLGLAPINVAGGTAQIEGFPAGTAGTTYGGANAAHDCGTLHYVRIEFAGFALAPNNELNGLTVGGCGSGTVLDYIQVHRGQDDGVEFFGGTANIKHVVVSQPVDDGIDWDFGWTGKAQFLIVQQATELGNNGFEADNNNPNFDLLPRSNPTIYNVTLVGGNGGAATEGPQSSMLLRRGTAGTIRNLLATHFNQSSLDVDDAATQAQITGGTLTLDNAIFWANGGSTTAGNLGADLDADTFEAELYAAGADNQVVDPQINAAATSISAPVFTVAAGSPALAAGAGATPPTDTFFDATATFVGAIGAADWTAGWTAYPQGSSQVYVQVTADVTASTTWTADKVYVLTKHIAVTNGATLTVEPGTEIHGVQGSSLIVRTDGRIVADGTAAAPIVFTSANAAPLRRAGDWGGIVLLGLAPINVAGGTAQIEGFPAGTAGTTYGGANAAHDCGTLRYVRIEFAGFALAPNNELNGLTVGGCGSATVLDYIQVHRGQDDGVEFFGGTVNIKHVVVSQPVDDGIDWDFGWTGKAQFVIVQQATELGNNGFEADNNNPNFDLLPRSNPTIYNVTLVGGNGGASTEGPQSSMLLRRGTAGTIRNLLATHFNQSSLDVDDAATQAQITGGTLTLDNAIFWANGGSTTAGDLGADLDADTFEAELYATGADNQVVDPQIDAACTDLDSPNFTVAAGSPALAAGAGATPPTDTFFDATATFVGAIGAADWTAGWTAYPQN